MRLCPALARLVCSIPIGLGLAGCASHPGSDDGIDITEMRIDPAYGPGHPAPPRGITPDSVANFFAQHIGGAFEEAGVGGGVFVVVKDTTVIFARGFGSADREAARPVDPATTMFAVASVSKTFTATALMRLKDRGLLTLDDELAKKAPGLRLPLRFTEPIRVKHILTHSTGFPDDYLGVFSTDPKRYSASLTREIEQSARPQLAPPGRLISYTNLGLAFGGAIAEAITGKPFNQVIKEEVFHPLEMRAWIPLPDDPLPAEWSGDLAVGYDYDASSKTFIWLPEIYGGLYAAGGVRATGLAMANYMIMHLGSGAWRGQPFLQPATQLDMLAPHARANPRTPGFGWSFQESMWRNVWYTGHGGDHYGIDTDMILLPEHRVGYFLVFTGGSGAFQQSVLDRFMEQAFPNAKPMPPEPDSGGVKAPVAEYAGTYHGFRNQGSDAMAIIWPFLSEWNVKPNGADEILFTSPEVNYLGGHVRYRQVMKDLFRKVPGQVDGAIQNDYLSFTRDRTGRVATLFVGYGNNPIGLIKVPAWRSSSATALHLGLVFGVFALVAVLGPLVAVAGLLGKRAPAEPPLRRRRRLQWFIAALAVGGAGWLGFGLAKGGSWAPLFGFDALGVRPAFYLLFAAMLLGLPLAWSTLRSARSGSRSARAGDLLFLAVVALYVLAMFRFYLVPEMFA